MSFLTPLYLLGALAVGLPVLFHMIRRSPRSRQLIGSVMFLEPSPPRITRRSRIEHWLLLVLRSLAVCLLAFAFARPFFRVTQEQSSASGTVREFVLLLDTSASMRREGVWSEAIERMDALLDETRPQDRVSLVTFDRQSRVLADFDHWMALDPVQRAAAARRSLRELSPTWASTDLGRALMDAAEQLDAAALRDDAPRSPTIVVVSDLQAGSRLEALQTYEWPPRVCVRLERVGTGTSPNNAGVRPVGNLQTETPSDGPNDGAKGVRVRVTNAANSRREQFTLRWDDKPATAPPDDDDPSVPSGVRAETSLPPPVTLIVPPGQSRVVSVPPRFSAASRLWLEGDDHDFDNRCDIPVALQQSVSVGILSNAEKNDPQGVWYYVEKALASTPGRAVNIRSLGEFIADAGGASWPELVIVAASPSSEQTADLRNHLQQGGTLLFVPLKPDDVFFLYDLIGVTPVEAAEAEVGDYAMLTDIDFSHPLFTALGQPRYSDFTKVRFWKHRTIDPATLPRVRVIARFDDGDVAIGETRVGDGRCLFFLSGWHPDDSQLALSTKFVPMLNGLLDDAAGIGRKQAHYLVGDTVDLTAFARIGSRVTGVRTPAGDLVRMTGETVTFSGTDQPGQYQVLVETADGKNRESGEFVVSLDPSESRTAPLALQRLQTANVRLGTTDDDVSAVDGLRQLRGAELENQQSLWRWLILAVMLLLIAETWLAGRTSRSTHAGPR